MAFVDCALSFAARAELVEALVCWFDKHAWVQGGSRESPGMRVTFFCFAKRKLPKKRRPPVCDPFASLRGKPAAGRLRGAPQNSLRACGAPFGQLRRVRARSMGASTPMPPHNRPAAGAASRGWAAEPPTAEQPHGPLLRSAVPAQRETLAPAWWGRAQRSEAMARVDVRFAGSLHEHRRLPAAQRRDAACRVALSLVTFFRRDERKLLACRATPGLRPEPKHALTTSPPRLRAAQPERLGRIQAMTNSDL